MEIGIFSPQINKTHRFAVAVPTDAGTMSIIQTYPDREQLEAGYTGWLNYATEKGITKPCPIEILDETLKCRIIKELIFQ